MSTYRLSLARAAVLGALALGMLGLSSTPVALAAGDVNETACPNEALIGFTPQLPDCRAYEMVTPVYKEGFPFGPVGFSSSGEQVFLGGFATVAGTEGQGESTEPAIYMGKRSAGAWPISPMNPPQSRYARQLLVRLEADSGVGLWEQHTLAQSANATELYVRSATGGFSRVGPLLEPAVSTGEPSNVGVDLPISAVAASDETSEVYDHIVVRSQGPETRWWFDKTLLEGSSLYEYNGVGNSEPVLVAVVGEKGSRNQAGFECGVYFGSRESENSYNAISRDGETVFFTPELQNEHGCPSSADAPAAAEVWARVHGAIHSPAKAETVDVSGRSPSECAGPCEMSAEAGKFFEGASETGEKVFFTSTQQLLNGAHQDPNTADNAAGGGGCAETTGEGGCNLYEYDFAAPAGHRLKVIAPGAEVLGVARVSEDGSRVYFVARGALTPEANEYGAHAQPGQPNLYVYNTANEHLEPHGFIATLDGETDARDWSAYDEHPVQTSPADGRFLVFSSGASGLTPDDSAKAGQLFAYDAQAGELVRISKAEGEEAGSAENGNATESTLTHEGEIRAFSQIDFKSTANASNIAVAEGASVTVVFESAGMLSPLASASQAGCSSVYEYRSARRIAAGGVHLISDGLDAAPHFEGICGATFYDMDATGKNILFSTADSLLASDTDSGQRDIYDARLDGGVAVPSQGAAQCEPVACGTPVSAAPPLLATGSSAQVAEGNAVVTVTHPSHTVPRKKLTRARRLARALRACRSERSRHGRASCEAAARKLYGSKVNRSTQRSRG